jgi:hypothetical protein
VKPPMFAPPRAGSAAQQYFHRATMFREAAMRLYDYVNAEPCWPKYALLTHAIELSLKAFIHHSAPDGLPPGKEPKQHDLTGWYALAIEYGLKDEPEIRDNVDLLNALHETHYARYPQNGIIPSADVIADGTVDHLMTELMQMIYPR